MWDRNAYKRECYHKWREQGLCGKCGKRWAEAGHSKCRICRIAAQKSAKAMGRVETLNEYKRNQKADRKAKGLCTNCGKPLSEKELGVNTRCIICRKKARERQMVQRLRMRIHGIPRKRYNSRKESKVDDV